MTALEIRATSGLAAIYAVRMAGLFMILPVFMLYSDRLSGATPFLMGMAIGIYGLTQALLQIPFGVLSDRVGRKPLIALGLGLLILGSLLAATADSIMGILVGRALQGAGAVAAVILALTADLVAEEHRTRAMAVIGMSIGLTFLLAMVLGPVLDQVWGLSGLFWLTAVLGGLGILLLYFWVPDPERYRPHPDMVPIPSRLQDVLRDRELMRLNGGIFLLHAILAANFLVIPVLLVEEVGLASADHYQFYLPVLLGGFLLMVPAILYAERQRALKPVFLGAILLLLMVQILLPFALNLWTLLLVLVLFFAAFNLLEASLPSLIAKTAPLASKGAAMGVFSTSQFLGIFCGGAMGGIALQYGGQWAVFLLGILCATLWLGVAQGMARPSHLSQRSYALPIGWQGAAAELQTRLQGVAGVAEVRVHENEAAVHLKIDRRQFTETAVGKIFRTPHSSTPTTE